MQNYAGEITWKPSLSASTSIISFTASASEIQTANIKVTQNLSGGNLTYSSNKNNVKVDSTGKVTVAKNFIGTAMITIKSAPTESFNTESQITVKIAVNRTAGKVIANNITLNANASIEQSKNIVITSRVGSGKLTYSSDSSSVTVDDTGKVTVAKNYAGTATITIKADTSGIYKAASTSIKVTVNKIAGKVTANPVTFNANASKTQSKNIVITSQLGKGKLTYSSSSPSVTVDSTGKVTVAKNFAGTATITVKAAASGIYKTASTGIKVTVNRIAGNITANDFIKTSMTNAQSFFIGATRLGSGKLTYSTNSSKVTVDGSGKVTIPANYSGIVTITIKAASSGIYNEATKKIKVTVNPRQPAISSLSNSFAEKMTVQWKRVLGSTGYRVQFSTDKTFKTGVRSVNVSPNNTLSKVLSSLTKGKTYYVHMRTYKTVGDTTLYSKWSPIKTLKITK